MTYTTNFSQQNNLSQTRQNDSSWDILGTIGHLYMWEEIVCLYIMTLDFEDINLNEEDNVNEFESYQINPIKEDINVLTKFSAPHAQHSDLYINLIDRYWESRKSNNQALREKVRLFINKRLETNYFNREKTENYLKHMTNHQKQMLRNNFVSRIYGYSKIVKKHVLASETANNNPLQEGNAESKESQIIKRLEEENKLFFNNKELQKDDELLIKLGDHEEDQSIKVFNYDSQQYSYVKSVRREPIKSKRDYPEHGILSENNTSSEKILYPGKKSKSEDKSTLEEIGRSLAENNEIDKLKQENIKLRAALGEVVNVEWHDDNANNSSQLVKEVESLNRNLNKITGVKRKVKEIKMDAVKELFSSFNCTTSVESKQMKLVLSAVLQQHLIKFILKSASDYLSQPLATDINDDKLEVAILSKADDLINLTTRFEVIRTGTDEHSRLLPTKLRQHVYAALGFRGFSNHPFVTQLAKDLMDEMNKYRILESEEKTKKELTTIVIQVLRIFLFRFKTQEPVPTIEFYQSGKDIDPVYMEGMWEGHYEDYEVEICYFPAIIVKSDERAYTKAQVIARQKLMT
ncbi:10634_t:CDS:1 [Funneliformis geosporum]|uniref:4058_t:CDS:1 n=1 Tax=Funneliformis geosporum TaxID=1117311 RepID=A0A9W4WYF7_9GLOM|nr:4058_t:CDS:1 [Funneliformis geosporum]CAI2181731.1 10634_t:CDS:1 [Funneliformis geosporum]